MPSLALIVTLAPRLVIVSSSEVAFIKVALAALLIRDTVPPPVEVSSPVPLGTVSSPVLLGTVSSVLLGTVSSPVLLGTVELLPESESEVPVRATLLT